MKQVSLYRISTLYEQTICEGSLLLRCHDNTNSSPSAPAHFFVRDDVSTRIALVFARSKWTKWNWFHFVHFDLTMTRAVLDLRLLDEKNNFSSCWLYPVSSTHHFRRCTPRLASGNRPTSGLHKRPSVTRSSANRAVCRWRTYPRNSHAEHSCDKHHGTPGSGKRCWATQRCSRHPFVCAVCHSKPPVLCMEIRRSRMSAFLTSYAHAFCTVTWRDLVLHVQKKRKRRSLLYRELYPFQKFAIPLEYDPYERGSVSTVVVTSSWSECLSDQRFAAKLCARWAAKRRLISNVRHGVISLSILATSHRRLANYKAFATVYFCTKSDKKWLQTKPAK